MSNQVLQNDLISFDSKYKAYRSVSPDLATRLDDTTTASVTYVGKAAIGTATSAASWQVQKIDETTGLVITWADGDADFNNIWDNRASLTYS